MKRKHKGLVIGIVLVAFGVKKIGMEQRYEVGCESCMIPIFKMFPVKWTVKVVQPSLVGLQSKGNKFSAKDTTNNETTEQLTFTLPEVDK